MQPLIGITSASIVDNGMTFNRVYHPIAAAVADAGGLPVYIPTGLDEATLRAIYERVDGVLLPGGPDIDPAYYGETPHPTTNIDPARDALEVPIARWAVSDDMPLFGICRGHQVINVALGGTLVQDIPSQLETNGVKHDVPNRGVRDERLHEVEILPESRLASIIGSARVPVNSLHHQIVAKPAPNLHVTAYSPDGLIEGLEMPDKHFVLTVQWHPEDLYRNDDSMRRLFAAFVEAARERASRR